MQNMENMQNMEKKKYGKAIVVTTVWGYGS